MREKKNLPNILKKLHVLKNFMDKMPVIQFVDNDTPILRHPYGKATFQLQAANMTPLSRTPYQD
jgi:hypothetical protein